jgi:hypothetical protein
VSEQQAAAPPAAAQTLNQVNHDFAASRAAKLDAAINTALASRMPAPVKKPASVPSAAPTNPAPVSAPSQAEPLAQAPDAAPAADPDPVDAALGSAPEPAPEPTEGEPQAFDAKELTALAKKDRRALEAKLGLEEGVLGVTNGDYASYRRRVDAVEVKEREVQSTHDSNQSKLIAKFGPAVDLIQHAGRGDMYAFARLIETTSGIPIQVFVDQWAKNNRFIDPRALQQQQAPAPAAPPPAAPMAAPGDRKAAAQAKADEHIAAEAKGHAALSLKGGAGEVRAKWLASFDKPSNSFRLTPQQAADAVVTERRAALEQEQWLLSGKTKPPAKPVTRSVSRQGASETQPRKQNLSRNELIERGALEIRRQKAADAARTRR